jgi:transcriptional regulator with XRE-family HTH domain
MLERIKRIMDYYGLSSSGLADKIGAQRSAVSHVLSGRNRPSLDFVLKVKDAFPGINLDWLILGKGEMFVNDAGNEGSGDTTKQPELDFGDETVINDGHKFDVKTKKGYEEGGRTVNDRVESEQVVAYTESAKTEIDMIVHYYKNGTFRIYRPR